MILITGGAFQGKLDCARRMIKDRTDQPVIADGGIAGMEEIAGADIWNHFHLWVKRMLTAGADMEGELDRILAANPNLVVVTQELGCGLVPVDAFEREYRETSGRLGCRLAERADAVYLVSCGIPLCIKGEGGEC